MADLALKSQSKEFLAKTPLPSIALDRMSAYLESPHLETPEHPLTIPKFSLGELRHIEARARHDMTEYFLRNSPQEGKMHPLNQVAEPTGELYTLRFNIRLQSTSAAK